MSNLTDALIRSAKPRDRYYDLNDRGTPLMLRVKQNGEKVWLWRGRVGGKQTTRIIGSYPEMKLSEAKLEALRLKSAAKSGAIKAHGNGTTRLSAHRAVPVFHLLPSLGESVCNRLTHRCQ